MTEKETTEARTVRIDAEAFSTRTRFALLNAGLETLGDIVDMGSRELALRSGVGGVAMAQVGEILEALGLDFPKQGTAPPKQGIELRSDYQRLTTILAAFDGMGETEQREVWLFLGNRYIGDVALGEIVQGIRDHRK